MKKYRYVEFTDGVWRSATKSGKLYLVAKNPEDYVEELGLERDYNEYTTTLANMGELGWELAFVTPCGSLRQNGGEMLQNAYIFKKEIEG